MTAVATTCSFEGCSRPHCAKGLCNTHYCQSIRKGKVKPIEDRGWTPIEIERLTLIYGSTQPRDWVLSRAVAKYLPRHTLISAQLKASKLGLTSPRGYGNHRGQLELEMPRMTVADRHLHQSKLAKERIAKGGHPRGMLGKKHSAETKAAFSEAIRQRWRDPKSKFNTPEHRQLRSDRLHKLALTGKLGSEGYRYSRCRAGTRADLGIFVRSAWEANYARFLNFLKAKGKIVGWAYEAKTFDFEKVKRGTRCYTPDFRVEQLDGSIEWHEVKGWMDDKSRVRLERMAKFYPDEKVIVIGSDWFKANVRNLSGVIVGWER